MALRPNKINIKKTTKKLFMYMPVCKLTLNRFDRDIKSLHTV